MKEQSNQAINNNGIGFFGLLAIVFITMKLTNIIDWNWFWVLCPLWIPLALTLVMAIVVFGLFSLAFAIRLYLNKLNSSIKK
jgi:uncharacterized membrane protein